MVAYFAAEDGLRARAFHRFTFWQRMMMMMMMMMIMMISTIVLLFFGAN